MTVTASSFRQNFTEFSEPAVYGDPAINFWLTVSATLLDPTRWGTMLDLGTQLFIAHHLVLAARDQLAARAGGVPGAVQGVLTSKSVDKVSASYDAGSVALTDAGFWNMSSYGIRFLQYARYMGAGGIQV
jgi:hypothetical protein